MYIYDEVELLEFFGVEPIVTEEFGRNLSYEYTDGIHRLVFGFNADTSDCSVQVFLKANNALLLSFVYLGSPGARVKKEKKVACLEVGAPDSAPGASSEWFVPSEGLRIHLEPTILVENIQHA